MTDPEPVTEFDVVVIGAGPVGENAADRAHQGGLSVAVVEAALVGGECSYTACIPSKALLRGPVALEEARAVRGAREAVTGPADAEATLDRRDSFIHDSTDDGQVSWLEGAGLTLVRGQGRLAGERMVEVTRPDGSVVTLSARHAVVVSTGSTPAVPPIPGLVESHPWTNRESTRAEAVPERLIVLGAGPVGCEQALAWKLLGSESVVVVDRGPHPLGRNEPFAGELVREGLEAHGVEVRTNAVARKVERTGNGPFRVWVAPADGPEDDPGQVIEAERLLVALGRRPGTTALGLESVGLEPGASIESGPDGRVAAVPGGWLYAVGDVNGKVLLTHMGKYQARACGAAIAARARGELGDDIEPWSRFSTTAQDVGSPQVVFTSPEVAAVGLTEAEARDRGLRVTVVDYEIGEVAGAALHADDYRGHAKMVVDDDRRVVVGVTLVGPGVGEMIHAATVAIVGEVPLDRLWHATPSFPTMSELWLRLLETYGL